MDTLMLLNNPQPRRTHQETVASPFYSHPYGGIARSIKVSRDGFMRFFELDELGMKILYHQEFNGKIIDRRLDNHELLGYHDRGKFTITIVDHTHGALMRHAIRTTVQNQTQ
jgi:hypothetical protein